MQNIKILIQLIESKALNIQKHVIEFRKKNVKRERDNKNDKVRTCFNVLSVAPKLEPKVEKLSW